ncbi:MAG: hypothetical protein WKF36_07080 [Candidatus Nitrosocosmicus sp.]
MAWPFACVSTGGTSRCLVRLAANSWFANTVEGFKPVDAASHSCEEKGKSQDWIKGCKSGWYDQDNCYGADPDDVKSQAFYGGYFAGWKIGHCSKYQIIKSLFSYI